MSGRALTGLKLRYRSLFLFILAINIISDSTDEFVIWKRIK